MALNWDQLRKQLFDWGGDYDIFSDVSVDGGARDAGIKIGGTSIGTQGALKPGYDASGHKVSASTQTNSSTPSDQSLVDVSVGGPSGDGGAGIAAAANAAKAAKLRGDVTTLANTVKDIFNSRYGQVDQSAQEQTGKLNDRFNTESQDITNQVADENAKLGAAHAATGTYDSSYRGNNVDTVTHGGEGQIRDLGQELQDNLAKIAAWVTSQKSGFDAQKGGMDAILSHLAEETDPNNLSQIRSTLEGRIADLRAGNADNNTQAQNMATLSSIAPSSVRAQQLKTTLSQIVAGNADSGTKSAIGQKLIQSANLSPQEQQELLGAFNGDLAARDKKQPA